MSKEQEDMFKPGFVSTIVMKFSQLSNSGSINDDLRSTSCRRTPTTTKKQVDPEIPKSPVDIGAKFEIRGEVSVKDKIKAFSEITEAMSTAAMRPGFLSSKQMSNSSSTTITAVAKSSVANRFLKSVEKQMETKEIKIQKESPVNTHISIKNRLDTLVKTTTESTAESTYEVVTSPLPEETPVKTEHFETQEQAMFDFEKEYKLADFISTQAVDKEEADKELVVDAERKESSVSTSSVGSLLGEFASSTEKKLIYPEVTVPETDNSYYPLPKSYKISFVDDVFTVTLPDANKKSALKKANGVVSEKKRSIKIAEQPISLMETYNIEEYERGDDSIDPLTASAEYEIERKTENLEQIVVKLEKDERGLGLSIVGIGLGSDSGSERLGIFIKALTPGGSAEATNMLRVHDQILFVDGVSLVGVSQSFAAQTLKGTSKVVNFVIGREKANESK